MPRESEEGRCSYQGRSRRVDNGRKRLLGIPTVIDRMLQQAVLAAQRHINEGYSHIVDIDLKTFFDEVDHCILLQLLYRKVKCPLTMRLIRKWLRAPILINGKLRDLDGWVRNRLRYCIWHDWKKPERRRKSLMKRGYQSTLDLYMKISPQFNEPLITWPRAERKKCPVDIFSE